MDRPWVLLLAAAGLLLLVPVRCTSPLALEPTVPGKDAALSTALVAVLPAAQYSPASETYPYLFGSDPYLFLQGKKHQKTGVKVAVGIHVGDIVSRVGFYYHSKFHLLATIPSAIAFPVEIPTQPSSVNSNPNTNSSLTATAGNSSRNCELAKALKISLEDDWEDEGEGCSADEQNTEKPLVGQAALDYWHAVGQTVNSTTTNSSANRFRPALVTGAVRHLLGRKFRDPAVQRLRQRVPFDIIDREGAAHVLVDTGHKCKVFQPQELYSMFLRQLKHAAEHQLSQLAPQCFAVTAAVLAVEPGYYKWLVEPRWGERQPPVQALHDAAKLAGLQLISYPEEPVASAKAHRMFMLGEDLGAHVGFGKWGADVLVMDFSSTALNTAVLLLDTGETRVLSHSSLDVGGDALTERVVDHFLSSFFEQQKGYDPCSADEWRKLRAQAEKARNRLEFQEEVVVKVGCHSEGPAVPVRLTRSLLQKLTAEVLEQIMQHVDKVVKDHVAASNPKVPPGVHLPPRTAGTNISHVLITGSEARNPLLRQLLRDYFPPEVGLVRPGLAINGWAVPAQESVVYGAAVEAAQFNSEADGPWKRSCCGVRKASSKINCNEWDSLKDCPWRGCIFDVNAMTLGVETAGGVMTELMPRNLIVTNARQWSFVTTRDNQTRVILKVFAGDRGFVSDNWQLGQLTLDDVPPGPAGTAQVVVALQVEHTLEGNTLTATATNPATGNTQSLRIKNTAYAWIAEYEYELNRKATATASTTDNQVNSAEAPNVETQAKEAAAAASDQQAKFRILFCRDMKSAQQHEQDNSSHGSDNCAGSAETCAQHKRDAEGQVHGDSGGTSSTRSSSGESAGAGDAVDGAPGQHPCAGGAHGSPRRVLQGATAVLQWARSHKCTPLQSGEAGPQDDCTSKLQELETLCQRLCLRLPTSQPSGGAASGRSPGAKGQAEEYVKTRPDTTAAATAVQLAPQHLLKEAAQLCHDVAQTLV